MGELLDKFSVKKVYFRDRVFEKEGLLERIDHLAKYLGANFISGSPFVLLSAYNHIKALIAFYAILKAGKIALIVNPGTKSIEFSEMVKDTDPAALILPDPHTLDFKYEEEIIFREPDPGFTVKSDLTDVCLLAYTNAEDGYAKGAMILEKNLVTAINAYKTIDNLSIKNTTCPLLPFHHLFGIIQVIFRTVITMVHTFSI